MAYYLDLFNGNPSGGGVSVMSAITGSSARQDVTNDLVQINTLAYSYITNPDYITVSDESENQTNINWVALYSAATDGNLLCVLPLSSHYTIAKGNPVQFDPLDLQFIGVAVNIGINLSSTSDLSVTITVSGEIGVVMITEGLDEPMLDEAGDDIMITE